ncbi:MAG: response regulator [Candidatus Omnitrophica bacterium]|nr:response regulator [Candidatus Omnitrophota bacterium]
MDRDAITKSLGNGEILIVDDDAGSRDLLVRFFKLIGCEHVTAVANGEEAIRYAHSQTPTLVLLDYLLPEMSGLETLRQMKQLHPDLPVLMMTAYPSRDALAKAAQAGASEILVKPLDLRKLEQHILQGPAH